MIDEETKNYIDDQILNHNHNGNAAQQVDYDDIFGTTESVNVAQGTIATTGNTDIYFLAPSSRTLIEAYFSGTDALATSNVNYITWSITNLGQAGAGSAALLSSADTNTTKTTGGSAISANTKRELILSGTTANLQVIQGDRIRIRAAVTGTLANTVTFPNYLLIFR